MEAGFWKPQRSLIMRLEGSSGEGMLRGKRSGQTGRQRDKPGTDKRTVPFQQGPCIPSPCPFRNFPKLPRGSSSLQQQGPHYAVFRKVSPFPPIPL